jgi:hypothetical protein
MKLEVVRPSKARGHASHPDGSLNSAIMLVIKFKLVRWREIFFKIYNTLECVFKSVRCTEAAACKEVNGA